MKKKIENMKIECGGVEEGGGIERSDTCGDGGSHA